MPFITGKSPCKYEKRNSKDIYYRNRDNWKQAVIIRTEMGKSNCGISLL